MKQFFITECADRKTWSLRSRLIFRFDRWFSSFWNQSLPLRFQGPSATGLWYVLLRKIIKKCLSRFWNNSLNYTYFLDLKKLVCFFPGSIVKSPSHMDVLVEEETLHEDHSITASNPIHNTDSLGKKQALEKYDQFTLNTGWFLWCFSHSVRPQYLAQIQLILKFG